MMRSGGFQWVPAAACLLLAGCMATGPRFDPRAEGESAVFEKVELSSSIPGEMLEPPSDAYKLGPGDKVEIEVLEVEGTREACFVLPDGKLHYQMLPGIPADGRTLVEVKEELTRKLSEYYRAPQVSVVLRGINSRSVWVLGRVNTPGLYPLDEPMTVLEAISRAGGLFTSRFSGTTEELADLQHSFLMRGEERIPVDFYALIKEGDLSQNVYLQDGDYLYLPSALSNEIYVLGAVRQPRAVGYMDRVTLVNAVAAAKGTTANAFLQRVLVVRGSLQEPRTAVVNLGEILEGKQSDILLQPRDIVWVPNSPWSGVKEYTRLVLDNFARTVAANEGARAVDPDAQPVRTSVTLTP